MIILYVCDTILVIEATFLFLVLGSIGLSPGITTTSSIIAPKSQFGNYLSICLLFKNLVKDLGSALDKGLLIALNCVLSTDTTSV